MGSLIETRKFIFLGILALIALFGLMLATRQPNKWVCKNGAWIAQGNPTTSKPLTLCK